MTLNNNNTLIDADQENLDRTEVDNGTALEGEVEDVDEDEEPVRDEQTAEAVVIAGIQCGQLDTDSVSIDRRDLDVSKEAIIQQYVQHGCKCDLGPNKSPCSTLFPVEHFRSVRCQMAELSHDELDLVVMGQIMAGCFSSETSAHRDQERGKTYTLFHHNGKRVCQKTFLFFHRIGYWRFKAVKASFIAGGVAARVHGNTGKTKKFGLTLKEIQDVVQYIMNYAGVCSRERERKRERERERERKTERESRERWVRKTYKRRRESE